MASDVTTLVGQRIRFRREELDLTQPQLALRIKEHVPQMAVEKQRVSDWERGLNMPSDAYKPALVKALEVSDFSYFFKPFVSKEQPDVLDAITPPFSDDKSQLDRIEDKLEQITKQLGDGNLIDQITQIIAQATGRSQPSTDPPPSTPAAGTKPKGSRRRRAA